MGSKSTVMTLLRCALQLSMCMPVRNVVALAEAITSRRSGVNDSQRSITTL